MIQLVLIALLALTLSVTHAQKDLSAPIDF